MDLADARKPFNEAGVSRSQDRVRAPFWGQSYATTTAALLSLLTATSALSQAPLPVITEPRLDAVQRLQ